MIITSSRRDSAQLKAAARDEIYTSQAPESQDSESKIKDMVTKSAYATGGALGGVGLGVVTGQILSNLTGTPVFANVGGAAGAIAGAATALSASNAEDTSDALISSFLSWTGSSLGSTGGMFALGAAGAFLANHGAAAIFASQGQLIGAATGGLIGATLPQWNSEQPVAIGLRRAAVGAAGASAGLYLGGAAQALMRAQPFMQSVPGLLHTSIPVPALLALTGALNALDRDINYVGRPVAYRDGKLNENSLAQPKLAQANRAAVGGTLGYAVGIGAAAIAHGVLGASGLYSYAAPATAALAGGLIATGSVANGGADPSASDRAALTVLGTGVGAMAGDALGHGLAALTGHEIYRTLGPLAGGANGLSVAGNMVKIAPTITGVLAGTSAGALMGAGIGALTGQTIWGAALPALGGIAGVLTGVAITVNDSPAAPSSKPQP